MDQAAVWRAKGDETDRSVTKWYGTMRVGSTLRRRLAGRVGAGKREVVEVGSNYWKFRGRGMPVCRTIDTMIATRCIENGYHLLHSDWNVDPSRSISG